MTQRKPHLGTLAGVTLVGCCFLWGLNQVAAKVALPEVPALQQAAIRSLGGALLVWLWAMWRGLPLFERDGTLPDGLVAGLLFAAEFACIFIGLQFTTASHQLAISGVMLGIASAATGGGWPHHLSLIAWSSPAFQIVVVSFASYLLWFWLMRHYPATRLASFTLLTPVFGLVMGSVLLDEPITARLVVALLTVAIGIVVVNRPSNA